jgi:hypothetical protein
VPQSSERFRRRRNTVESSRPALSTTSKPSPTANAERKSSSKFVLQIHLKKRVYGQEPFARKNTVPMKKLISTRIASLVAGLVFFAGCATEQPAPASGPEMPPPPESEVIPPQPNMTSVWTPGYWDWQGRWIWVPGYWSSSPHPGAIWVQGHWIHHRGHYIWVRPHWQ